MAKKTKPTMDERDKEILDYKIAKADKMIQFYMEHDISSKKIDKLESNKARAIDKKSKL